MPRLIATKTSSVGAGPSGGSIRSAYERHGTNGFYEEFGKDYRNPHEPHVVQCLHEAVGRWKLDLGHVLDLAAGSGEVTLVLRALGCGKIDGIDPFTALAYTARTGANAGTLTFADIAAGGLTGRRYSLIVCSFALHLCEKSRLPAVAQQLSLISDALLIITPHKRPILREEWGWRIMGENVIDRVRSRYYNKS